MVHVIELQLVKEVTTEANKIVNDFTASLDEKVFYDVNSREIYCDSDVDAMLSAILQLRAKAHGLDLSFARRDRGADGSCYSTEKEIIGPARVSGELRRLGLDFGHALFNVKRVINDERERWDNQRSCEWLTDLFGANPFCEANKDLPGCEQFLDIYGNCEKILADAANKNAL